MSEVAPPRRADALDLFVELVSALDGQPTDGHGAFYDRICEAMCRLTSLERAGLMLYDGGRKLVVPVGSHGVEPELLGLIHGTLEETPIAQKALAEDRVVQASDLSGAVPERYAHLPGITMLTCVPVAAGERWLGVIFADRGGVDFTLTDEERHTMWTLGKLAALAASARLAASQQERSRQLAERIDLAREVHERVMQRLFGVSLALGAERDLDTPERLRCADEIQAALADLRDALSRSLAPEPRPTATTLRSELEGLDRHYKELPLEVSWQPGIRVPDELEPLAVSVLTEALRNADRHARPRRVRVSVGAGNGAFVLEVRNDGASAIAPATGRTLGLGGTGMGLRLAGLEAIQRGGMVEFGRESPDEWRVRLVVPLDGESL
jgi:signal transduction histidine kinase